MSRRRKKTPAATTTTRGTTPPPAPQTSRLAQPSGFEGSYQAFLGEAMALGEHEVKVFTGNAMVAFHNARAGVQAVLSERARLEGDPGAPEVDFARVEATVRVGEALVFATRRAGTVTAAKRDLGNKLSDAYGLRDVLLANAVALVKSKVLVRTPEHDEPAVVQSIQKGSGPIDAAQDCIDLASLFERNAERVRGRTPVTPEQVRRAAELGAELLHALRPGGVEGASDGPDEVAKAATVRDRMAALLARYHGYVARVGGWLWGHDLAAHVPLLRSRSVAGAPTPDDAPDGPVTPPAPPA